MQIDVVAKVLKHLHSVQARFYCPQTSLSLDVQCRDEISALKETFWVQKELCYGQRTDHLLEGLLAHACCACHQRWRELMPLLWQ